MASYSKRGGKYQLRWRDPDGVTNRAYTCPDLRTTRKVLQQIEECESLGETWRSPKETRPPGLIDLCDAYIIECRRLRAGATADQRETAIANFLRHLGCDDKHWRGPREFTKANLAAFYDYLVQTRKTGGAYASTQVRMIELWWTWIADTDEWGHFVGRPKRIELPAPLPLPAAVAPTWEEMDRVVEAAGGFYRFLFTLLRYLGLRASQALALRWDDFDLEAAELTIRPALGKTRHEKSGRVIPISKHLVAEMAGWGKREGYVVPIAHASRSTSNAQMQQMWADAGVREVVWKARVEDGRTINGHPSHAFRKGIESGLLALGGEFLAVEYILGHKLPGVVGSYLDPSTLPLRSVVDLIPKVGEARKVRSLTTGRYASRSQDVRAPRTARKNAED